MKKLPKGMITFYSDGATVTQLYDTHIVSIDAVKGDITLRTEGWITPHTIKCMNIALANTLYRVKKHQGSLWIEHSKNPLLVYEFTESVTVPLGGLCTNLS